MKLLIKLSLLFFLTHILLYGDQNISVPINLHTSIMKDKKITNPIAIVQIPDNKSNLLPITTILIVIAGFFITRQQLKNTQELAIRNTRIEVLSKNRQDWINTLRDELAKFSGKLNLVKHIHTLLITAKEKDDTLSYKELKLKFIENINELHTNKAKITLLINPNEPDHQQLIKILTKHTEELKEKKLINQDDLIKISQKILKSEWERVKEVN